MSDAPAPVRFEAHRGELVLGETVVPAEPAGPRGALRIGGPGGPVLCPVSFGERTRATDRAVASSSPRDALCAALLGAGTVADGSADRLVTETAVLWLAGAAVPGPSFSDTVLGVARAAGWDPDRIAQAEAADVDRLALAVGIPPAGRPWRRVVFSAGAADGLQALRDEMADILLARMTVEQNATALADGDAGPWRTRPAGSSETAGRGRESRAAVGEMPSPTLMPPSPSNGAAWPPTPIGVAPGMPDAGRPSSVPGPRSAPWPPRPYTSLATALQQRSRARSAAFATRDAESPRARSTATWPLSATTAPASQPPAAAPIPRGGLDPLLADRTRPGVAPTEIAQAPWPAGALVPAAGSPTATWHDSGVTDVLAALLEDEADLRGLAP